MKRSPTLALCTDLGVAGRAPESVELIPAGPAVIGRDGRSWLFDAIAAALVIESFQARNVPLPLDWEHASQHRAPRGEDAPAAAWINALEVRDGALWGVTEWTPRGAAHVESREYRFLSPVFDFDPETGRIVRLVSAGLTNTPNLHLQALNSEGDITMRSTKLVAALAAVLSLGAEATDDDIATALNSQKQKLDETTTRALNAEQAATPSLERFVPRADYDAVMLRATNAEQAIRTRDTDAHTAAVEAAIDSAVKAGKVTPASIEYYRAACSDQAGLKRFQEFVGAAAVIAPAGSPEKRTPSTDTALNSEERAVCAQLGISHEAFAKQRDAVVAG